MQRLSAEREAPLTYGILKAWDALRVVAPDTCRPFDRHRKGLVLAEGAGMVILERADHAMARGSRILAQIAGVGMSADAADLVAPTLEGAASAIRACLADANLSIDAIDYINAHGTSTVASDITEIKAIGNTVFGDAASACRSPPQSMHGHALGADGQLELIAVIEAIRRGIVPPTINIEELDPECDLDVTPGCAGTSDPGCCWQYLRVRRDQCGRRGEAFRRLTRNFVTARRATAGSVFNTITVSSVWRPAPTNIDGRLGAGFASRAVW